MKRPAALIVDTANPLDWFGHIRSGLFAMVQLIPKIGPKFSKYIPACASGERDRTSLHSVGRIGL